MVDLFVQVLILCGLFLAWHAGGALVQSFGAEEAALPLPVGRPKASPFVAFLTGVVQRDPEALRDVEQWRRLGLGLLGFVFYKALLTIPAWVRSGRTSGMREVGVQLESLGGGRVSFGQAVVRFVGQYVLFLLTAGISGLWVVWDRRKQALHDKLAKTCVVRTARVWEKPPIARLYDD